jgi:hypothetical protein
MSKKLLLTEATTKSFMRLAGLKSGAFLTEMADEGSDVGEAPEEGVVEEEVIPGEDEEIDIEADLEGEAPMDTPVEAPVEGGDMAPIDDVPVEDGSAVPNAEAIAAAVATAVAQVIQDELGIEASVEGGDEMGLEGELGEELPVEDDLGLDTEVPVESEEMPPMDDELVNEVTERVFKRLKGMQRKAPAKQKRVIRQKK